MSPYQHQFPSQHPQSHGPAHQQPSLATATYLGGAQMSPFGAANGLGSLGAGFGVGVGMGDQTGLASQAARMGFAHGAQLQQLQQQQQQQQQQQSHGLGGEHPSRQGGVSKGRIRDVWKQNLDEEMAVIRVLIDDYQYVAMVSCQNPRPPLLAVAAPILTKFPN